MFGCDSYFYNLYDSHYHRRYTKSIYLLILSDGYCGSMIEE